MANLDNFDLMGHLNMDNKESRPVSSATVQTYMGNTDSEQIYAVTNELVSRGIDITDGYKNWLKLAFALKDGLGEEGRTIFHELSRMNHEYNMAECDRKYSSCMRSSGSGITIKTFFQMAKDAGVDVAEVAREALRKEHEVPTFANAQQDICANNANVPTDTNSEKVGKNVEIGGLQEVMPSGTLAQLAQRTFSDKLRREDIPSILWPVMDSQSNAVGRDKMLLGSLNLISGLLPKTLYSIYDRRKVYAPLYNIIYGRFATSKGDLEAVKQIVMPVKLEMRRKYEAEKSEYEEEMSRWEAQGKKERGPQPKEPTLCSPFISANSSASAVYRAMDANGGWGEMFETESDTLANMLSKSEYGDYSDLLRKAHHHEAIAMVRVSDHINIEIDDPRLSVFLTCTGSQLPLLLPASNVANGLASRFLFYALPDSKVEFRNVFEGCDNPIEDVYKNLGQKLLPLYHALLMREQHPLQFIMSKAQQREFVETFDAVLREQFAMLGDGIQGFIYRLALECYRYTMVLTALRRLSEWDAEDSIFDDDEQALVCDDRDFHTAMTIIECLVNHTGRVYAVLATKDDDPFSKLALQPSAELKHYYEVLPGGREFKTAEAIEVAQTLAIAERTAKRLLGEMVTKYQVIDHPRHGIYVKVKPNQDEQ